MQLMKLLNLASPVSV